MRPRPANFLSRLCRVRRFDGRAGGACTDAVALIPAVPLADSPAGSLPERGTP